MKQYLMAAAVLVACVAICVAQKPAPAAPAAEHGMAMEEVESTLIDSVGYAATEVLTIKFVGSEEVYEYQKVPEAVYKELMAAESKGSYFAKNVKGKYEFVKKSP